jgi:hypothetical protein
VDVNYDLLSLSFYLFSLVTLSFSCMRRENCLTVSIARVFVGFLCSMANGAIQVAFCNFSCADGVLTLVKVELPRPE